MAWDLLSHVLVGEALQLLQHSCDRALCLQAMAYMCQNKPDEADKAVVLAMMTGRPCHRDSFLNKPFLHSKGRGMTSYASMLYFIKNDIAMAIKLLAMTVEDAAPVHRINATLENKENQSPREASHVGFAYMHFF